MLKPSAEFIRETAAANAQIAASGRLHDLWDLLTRANRFFGDRDCIVEKQRGRHATYTVHDLYEDVRALGAVLQQDGFRGKHAAVIGENSYQWLVAFLTLACCGCIAVPLDKELTAAEIELLSRKADCALAFCGKAYQDVVERPDLPCCVFYDTFDDLLDRGRALLRADDDAFTPYANGDDTAAILFTSGTTGANKGVMLTHRNLVSNVDGVIRTNDPVYSALSVLPMNHAYELGSTILPHIYCGAVIYINDRLRNFFPNIETYHPEYIAIVPLFAENIRRFILSRAEKDGRLHDLNRRIRESERLRERGIDRRETLFAAEREPFGYMFPYLACGGAPLKPETAKFLDALGFHLLLGYGLTETSPIVTLNQNAGKYPSSVGIPFPFTRVRIDAPNAEGIGEVCVSGDNVSPGYYRDNDATQVSFANGWFKTGDYGRIGKSGELYITGRKKNLIILPNGKNIFPEELEYHFSSHVDAINDAVVFESDRRTGKEDAHILVLAVTLQESVADAQSLEMIREEIDRSNRLLPVYKRVQDVQFSSVPFARTSTKKIIRKAVKNRYETDGNTVGDFKKIYKGER